MLFSLMLCNIYWNCYPVICLLYYRSSSPYTTPHDPTCAGPSGPNEWQRLVTYISPSPRITFKARSRSRERSRVLTFGSRAWFLLLFFPLLALFANLVTADWLGYWDRPVGACGAAVVLHGPVALGGVPSYWRHVTS
jgi:hypothetical protein